MLGWDIKRLIQLCHNCWLVEHPFIKWKTNVEGVTNIFCEITPFTAVSFKASLCFENLPKKGKYITFNVTTSRRISSLPSVFGNRETKDCIDSLKCLHISNTVFCIFGIHVIFAEIAIMQNFFYTKTYLCTLKIIFNIYSN